MGSFAEESTNDAAIIAQNRLAEGQPDIYKIYYTKNSAVDYIYYGILISVYIVNSLSDE